MADDVGLGSKIVHLDEAGEARLRECIEAAGLIVKDLRFDPLVLTVSVPGATSNDEAATRR
jgi:hypothetical protein